MDRVPRRSTGDASRRNRPALLRSTLRFGRNTLGIPPSRALSGGRLTGLGAHATLSMDCRFRGTVQRAVAAIRPQRKVASTASTEPAIRSAPMTACEVFTTACRLLGSSIPASSSVTK